VKCAARRICDGDKFVNDYEEVVAGKKMKFRDTFQDIKPNSHTLVFVRDLEEQCFYY
jgi:hypothetical protein